MRNIGIATGLLFLLTTQAFADELTLQQLREFQARQGVIVFAPVALELKDAKYELIAGEVAPDGGCKFSHTSEGNLADWPDDNAEAIIDVAIDRVRCEKVVMSGHLPMDDEMRKQLRNLPGRVIKGSENHTSGVETFDTFGIGELRTYAESSESTSSQSCCAATHAVGVYVEWDDGDHPVMQFFNTSITINYADSKITYEGSHVCDAKKEGDTWVLYSCGSTDYGYTALSGWKKELAEENNDHFCYCFSPCNGVWYGSYTHEANLIFSNSLFPGCGDGVSTHYDPSRVRLFSSGDYEITANTYLSGTIDGCGEYLRSKVLKYVE